jgi:hypothetical protein
METYHRAFPTSKTGRSSQPATSQDYVSSNSLKSRSFMGSFTDEEIVESIRKTREEHREIKFAKPSNFGGN